MSSRKLRESVGRRGNEKTDVPDIAALDILDIGNDTYDGDNGETRMRREAVGKVKELEEQLSTSLIPSSDGSFRFLRFQMTRTQLIAPDDIKIEEAEALGQVLAGMEDALQFWVGDWANLYISSDMNQFEVSEVYEDLAVRFKLSKTTVKNYAFVCRNLDAFLRRNALGFSIHREVASVPRELKGQEDNLLEWAETNNATVVQLKSFIAEKLSEIMGARDTISEDSFLFESDKIPKVNTGFKTMWAKARQGDAKAKKKLQQKIDQHRKWLDEVEQSLVS